MAVTPEARGAVEADAAERAGSTEAAVAPRAVLWDMDGTLVDTEPLWGVALDEVAAELGRPLDQAVRDAMTGTDDRTTMRMLAEYTGVAVTGARLDALHERIVDRVTGVLRDSVPVLEGAVEAVRGVRAAGAATALVTSSPRKVTEVVLEALAGAEFDAVVTAEDVERRKPDPLPYLLGAELLGVAPGDCWAVEDSPSGAEAAERAGCRVLLAPGALPTAHGPGRTRLAALSTLVGLAEAAARPVT
ncbi:HAD family hydrolase [Streptomonospora nanhaiensis]|uniref:HAD family hydrolase n=1 Tax=Streptomonospora nanhaiensis TaxID=1323731 RepID=UPI001C37FA2E|nr:HAD family phosphatase [Streptomonospora nanhaiensis]MBV2365270.1 HAD family phosphatase [Streptomonospora nanhaiensis]MBX9389819.1 HAD family phosphatase [Streptomonospora nanhaiensis]